MAFSTSTGKTSTAGLLFTLAVMLTVSCSSVNRTFTNREYKKNGYRITSPEGTFVYEDEPLMRKLKIDYGYDLKTYIDTDGDNKVDRVKYQNEEYTREEEGTKRIFHQADRLWKQKLELLDVPEVHKRWKQMTPSERLEEQSYFYN